MSYHKHVFMLLNILFPYHLNGCIYSTGMIFYLTNTLLVNISIISNNLLLQSNQCIILTPYFDSLDLKT